MANTFSSPWYCLKYAISLSTQYEAEALGEHIVMSNSELSSALERLSGRAEAIGSSSSSIKIVRFRSLGKFGYLSLKDLGIL